MKIVASVKYVHFHSRKEMIVVEHHDKLHNFDSLCCVVFDFHRKVHPVKKRRKFKAVF